MRRWPRALAIVCLILATVNLQPKDVKAQTNWFTNASKTRSVVSPHHAVVQIRARDGDGISQGTGTLVSVGREHGLIITNWHVVRDASGPIHVRFSDGFESAAQVLKADPDWDLAALAIWRPNTSPVSIAHIAPVTGERLTIAGFGPGTYREATGRLTQYVAPGKHLPYEMFEIDVEARNGDSGGPIFNANGELAGVLFGAGRGTTAGSFCGRVREFLTSVVPLVEATPPSQLAQTNIQPSVDNPISVTQPIGRTRKPTGQKVAQTPNQTRVPPNTRQERPLETVFIPGRKKVYSATEVSAQRSQPLAPAPAPKSSSPDDPPANRQKIVSALRVLGETPLDQIKTFLAIVGVVSLVLQFSGGNRRSD